MKLSVLANLYGQKSLDETLQILTSLGVHTVEIGAGGYPGKAHCNPEELLADEGKYNEFINTFKKYDVTVCALATHGNALHPDKAIAAQFDKDMRNTILLAEKLGIDLMSYDDEQELSKEEKSYIRKAIILLSAGKSVPEEIKKHLPRKVMAK